MSSALQQVTFRGTPLKVIRCDGARANPISCGSRGSGCSLAMDDVSSGSKAPACTLGGGPVHTNALPVSSLSLQNGLLFNGCGKAFGHVGNLAAHPRVHLANLVTALHPPACPWPCVESSLGSAAVISHHNLQALRTSPALITSTFIPSSNYSFVSGAMMPSK